MSASDRQTLIVALCGASGSIYGLRLLSALLSRPSHVYLIVSSAGKKVMAHECGYAGESMDEFLRSRKVVFHEQAKLSVLDEHDFFTPPASGSFRHQGMVIVPCTMGTLGAIASGLASNLIQRAADVCLKEKRPLILVPRETPFNMIHLENMLTLARAGATIVPPSPSFYSNPQTIDDLADTVVARILDHLGIPQGIIGQWGL